MPRRASSGIRLRLCLGSLSPAAPQVQAQRPSRPQISQDECEQGPWRLYPRGTCVISRVLARDGYYAHGADCRDCGCEFERWLFGGFKFMIFR